MKPKFLLTALISLLLFSAATAENKATVVAYCPAPGQFINTLPACSADADSVTVAAQAQKNIERGSLVSLGGFGGYIIFRFDKPVANSPEEYDLMILGNAASNSSEPGIITVSRDKNHNGLPDDEWYEIHGSEHTNATFNYAITYHKPSADDDAAENVIDNYIRWEDNEGGSGWLAKNSFHYQSYYPIWIKSESMTFTGTRLPDNSNYEDGIYKLHPFDWGYADNYPNTNTEKCSIKIDWAKDADGNAVNLQEIDFVKIYSGQNIVRGGGASIGEASPEIAKIIDLHSDGTGSASPLTEFSFYTAGTTLVFSQPTPSVGAIYNITGTRLLQIPAGEKIVNLDGFKRGIYIMKFSNRTIKFIL